MSARPSTDRSLHDIDAHLDSGAAALHHLRQRRRRQAHPDRPAALRVASCSSRTSSPRSRPTRSSSARSGGDLDFALLVDGLTAEREQGITIDVAYRFFSTERRKFIVADTPGHEQYTRNMVTGASTADLAVILVDARKGVLTQTRRHSYLVSLLGIRHVVLAVNKMDLVGYSPRRVFDAHRRRLSAVRRRARARPTSRPSRSSALSTATTSSSTARTMPWYAGPDARCAYLETVEIGQTGGRAAPFRLPVQWVNRPDPDFRGFAGDDRRAARPPGRRACACCRRGARRRVARIVTADGDLSRGRRRPVA